MKYFVVLFKNKKKKKIINKFMFKKHAVSLYKKLIKESENVFFNKKLHNTEECTFELGLISTKNEHDSPTYLKDELGRSHRVNIKSEDNLYFIEISPYNVEEKIFDIKDNKKINIHEFSKKYLSKGGLKSISILNHKIVVQNEDKFNLFSLKSEEEALRFLDALQKYLTHINNNLCMILKSTTLPQKKYMYDLLTKNGFDPYLLYRKFTAQPRPKQNNT